MSIRAVLFDATGVLIEPAENVGQTYSKTALAFGIRLPAWRLADAFRRVLRHAPGRVFPGRSQAEAEQDERAWWRERVRQTFEATDGTARFEDFEAFFNQVFEYFERAEAWHARPGAFSAMCALHRSGYLTGVISNFDYRLPRILEGLGFASVLDVTMIPSSCGAAKPDPAIFRAALSRLGLDPREAAYIGHDLEHDIEGAAAAGLSPVLLTESEEFAALPARIARIANLGP